MSWHLMLSGTLIDSSALSILHCFTQISNPNFTPLLLSSCILQHNALMLINYLLPTKQQKTTTKHKKNPLFIPNKIINKCSVRLLGCFQSSEVLQASPLSPICWITVPGIPPRFPKARASV